MCFWELAKNNQIQSELIAEIDDVTQTMNSKSISYKQLQSMQYLDMFIHETLRKHPPLPHGTRICNKDCSISTSDGELFKFLKGDLIHIPFKLMQNDAKYFSDPDHFNPLRFKEFSNFNSFLAFGKGPRKCPANQYVLLQTKALIFSVLRKYSLENLNKSFEIPSPHENFFIVLKSRT